MKNFNSLTLHIGTKKKLDIWMSCHPDSVHPNDKERFNDLIREAIINDDLDALLNLNLYQVVKNYYPLWIEDYVNEFVQEKSNLLKHEVAKYHRKRAKESHK